MLDKQPFGEFVLPKKVALLWVHFGPYHLARLRAIRQRCAITAIQFAAGQQIYGWQSEPNPEVLTLGNEAHEHAGSLKTSLQLWRLLNKFKPAILFIPGYREPLAVTAAIWGKMHGAVNVLMFDSTSIDALRTSWKETFKARITRWLFQKAFVSGQRSAAYLETLVGRTLPVERGYDVIDNANFATRVSEIREKSRKDNSSSPFLFVGRLAAAKNLPLLLSAFASYKRRGGRRTLDIVGHGPLESSLKESAVQAGLADSVRFAGFQAYESLPKWYARACCLILPSVSEPWGLVVNEAMASGLPVIVSDRCGCVDDLVEDGLNGYIFSAVESESLTERMLAIDGLTQLDLEAMGKQSREIIARFTPDTWADAVVRLIEG